MSEVNFHVASGTVTQANMRISAAAGVSFVDFSDSEAAGNKLINHLGYLLKIKDSAGKVIQGFVRNAGTAETPDSNLVTNGADFTGGPPPTGWVAGRSTLAAVAGGEAGNCLEVTRVSDPNNYGAFPLTTVIGALYKFSGSVKSGTSGNEAYEVVLRDFIANSYVKALSGTSSGSWVGTSGYATATITTSALYFYKSSTTAGTMLFDTATVAKVLTPSATGVTISSTKGGTSLDNWAAKDSAFNYNDASGYSYELWKVNNAVEVASGSLAAGAVKASMVSGGATQSGGAFCDPVGLDLSPYADGKHILWLQNTTGGYVAFGKMKEAGGGEGLDAEKITGWTNGGFTTLTVNANGHDIDELTGGDGFIVAKSNEAMSTLGGLYKVPYSMNFSLGGLSQVRLQNTAQTIDGRQIIGNPSGIIPLTSFYNTETYSGTIIQIVGFAVVNSSSSTWSSKQVLTPSATGAVITDAAGLYNWSYKHASFNPNLACTYKILYIGDN